MVTKMINSFNKKTEENIDKNIIGSSLEVEFINAKKEKTKINKQINDLKTLKNKNEENINDLRKRFVKETLSILGGTWSQLGDPLKGFYRYGYNQPRKGYLTISCSDYVVKNFRKMFTGLSQYNHIDLDYGIYIKRLNRAPYKFDARVLFDFQAMIDKKNRHNRYFYGSTGKFNPTEDQKKYCKEKVEKFISDNNLTIFPKPRLVFNEVM